MPTYPFRHVRQRPHRSLGLGLVLCGPWCHCSLWSDCLCQDHCGHLHNCTAGGLSHSSIHASLPVVYRPHLPPGGGSFTRPVASSVIRCPHTLPCGSDTMLGSEREEQGGVSTQGAPVLPVAPTSSPFCTLRQKLSSERPAHQLLDHIPAVIWGPGLEAAESE